MNAAWRAFGLIACVVSLALLFALAEIQIEGAAGWAAALPTWRIEHHWLLDWFWGGRALTGYHVWVFSFMALAFHLPIVVFGRWSWAIELRILGSLALFWVLEDMLWFLLNPAFGAERFGPATVPWHKAWLGPLPTDYWVFGAFGLLAVAGAAALESRRPNPRA